MALTPGEIEARFEALNSVAETWGVSPSTLAQYVDMAGSYSNLTSRDSGVPRKLPPRASMEGIILASTVTNAVGTSNMRNVVTSCKLIRSRQEGRNSDSNPANGASDPGATSKGRTR